MVFLFLTIFFSNFSHSAELEGFKFTDEIKIENENLLLNGLAIRKATIFKIKILIAGLYLKIKSNDQNFIINSTSAKQIQIRFIKSLSSERISKMWTEQLLKRCFDNCTKLKEQATELGKLMIDIKPGDSLSFTFFEDHVKVLLSNNNAGNIIGKKFSKALLSLWIGKDPLDEELKKDYLELFLNKNIRPRFTL